MSIAKRFRSAGLAAVTAGALVLGLVGSLGPTSAPASSHREAPLTAAEPQIDNTDVYAFVSPDKPGKVTLISSWIPFEEPAGGPNFYLFSEGVNYDIRISNDADASTEIIWRWKFRTHYRNPNTFLYNTGQVTSLDDPDLNIYQTYDLHKINVAAGTDRVVVDNAIAVPSFVGNASMPNYGALFRAGKYQFNAGRSQTWVGQSDDPFFLDLRVFDLLYGGDFSEVGDDTLAGFNVHTLALQVPKAALAKNADPTDHPIIGVWSRAERRSTRVQTSSGEVRSSGPFVGVSRLGMPLVNEVVVPVGLKDYWNGSVPKNDEQFLGAVNDPELPHLIKAIYGIPVPDSNPNKAGIQRDDLIAVFLTGVSGLNMPANVEPSEMIRLNMSVAPCKPGTCSKYSRLGVIGGDNAGYPNGRRLADDVIDISLQVVEGELIGNANNLGDGVSRNDLPFLNCFPYVAHPRSGSAANPHPTSGAL